MKKYFAKLKGKKVGKIADSGSVYRSIHYVLRLEFFRFVSPTLLRQTMWKSLLCSDCDIHSEKFSQRNNDRLYDRRSCVTQ